MTENPCTWCGTSCREPRRETPTVGGTSIAPGLILAGTVTVTVTRRGAPRADDVVETQRYCPACSKIVEDLLLEKLNFTLTPMSRHPYTVHITEARVLIRGTQHSLHSPQ